MRLFDRYIARQYLTNIVALLAIMFGFVMTIDMALNLDRYWNQAERIAAPTQPAPGSEPSAIRVGLVTLMLVWDLWWPRLLQLTNFLSGLVMVAAMGFTVSHLVRHRELVAVLTSGQSLLHVARPILVVGLLVTLAQAVNQQWVIPRVATLLTRDPGDAGKRALGAASVPLTKDAQGRLLRAASFDADGEVLRDLYVLERDELGLAVRRITAARAIWRGDSWELIGGEMVTRLEAGGAATEPITRLETSLDPLALKIERYKGMSQNLSWGQLGQILSTLEQSGGSATDLRRTRDRLERIRYGRIATGLANMLTLVIAMTFFLTRDPRPMVLQALKCAPVGIVALIGSVFGAAAPVPGVPPQLSVFLPAMILTPVAIALVTRVRT